MHTRLARPHRRDAILVAAAAAFARAGFDTTSMSDVADEAGVTRVLLYRHFDTKEALYRAVLDEVLVELDTAWRSLVDRADGAALRSHLLAARARPDAYRLLWRQAASEPAFGGYAADVRAVIETIAAERLGDTTSPALRRWATSMLVSAIVESVLAWLDHGTAAHDEEFVATADEGLRRMVDGWASRSG